ncbi:hypothetical protein LS70_003880 [Helicobacter sp. MIT 11-5569]|uniref:hypothetical protein n=1 Tax=Helicobacter sp. MIT 11-5569 TaxID=1548151 RepID=UPI00051FA075|nr:hypothetical protein [Helicobacter sp. MIT 11-5569]TLD83958.1 hypothetical protein LS70_003880 [Helicobacter sp. MIT 11-5569]
MFYKIAEDKLYTQNLEGLEHKGYHEGFVYLSSEVERGSPFKAVRKIPEAIAEEEEAHLRELKRDKLELCNRAFDIAINALLEQIPQSELLSWNTQEAEARAFLSSEEEEDAPMLAQLSHARGIPLKPLAQKVIEKSDAYKMASGKLIGQRQNYEKAIEQAQSQEELEQIQIIYA